MKCKCCGVDKEALKNKLYREMNEYSTMVPYNRIHPKKKSRYVLAKELLEELK